jgi:site-specific DNA-cytosine methylase
MLIFDELFGGIGGFSEAAKLTGGFTTRNYVDIG